MRTASSKATRSGLTLMELVVVLLILVALAGLLVPMMSGVTQNAQQTTTQATMMTLRNAIVTYNQDMKLPAAWSVPSTVTLTAAQTLAQSTGIPLTLKDLVIQPTYAVSYNPSTGIGWRGPYLQQATGTFTASLDSSFYPSGKTFTAGAYTYGWFADPTYPDPAFIDGWGNPIILQWPTLSDGATYDSAHYASVRLVSAGPPIASGSKLVSVISTPSYDSSSAASPTPWIPAKASRGNNLLAFIFIQDPTP